jgi:hypothetical protein
MSRESKVGLMAFLVVGGLVAVGGVALVVGARGREVPPKLVVRTELRPIPAKHKQEAEVEPVELPPRFQQKPTKQQPAPKPQPEPKVIGEAGSMTAIELRDAFYHGNAVDVDARFLGKTVTVVGDVLAIQSNPNGSASILTGDFWVEVRFPKGATGSLRSLKYGDMIRIKGTCRGRQKDTYTEGTRGEHPWVVVIDGAELLATTPAKPGGGNGTFDDFVRGYAGVPVGR